jgi:hypothetical protein
MEGGDLRNSKRIAVVLAVTAVAVLVTASTALASHPRPKSASPLTFQLVPAFNACTTGSNGTHGAPLALPSCNPPVQTSQWLTLNAPDRPAPFNTAANGTGKIILKVTCVSSINPPVENGDLPPCNANPGDQEDVKITSTSTDIRCVVGSGGGQGNCVGTAGSLYNGKVLGSSSIRITDHYNATTGQPCAGTTTCVATVTDLPFDVGAQCTNGACNYTTSADAVVTNTVQELKRAVVGLGQITVSDAGGDGQLIGGPPPTTGVCPPACAQNDATFGVAFTQGLFIP